MSSALQQFRAEREAEICDIEEKHINYHIDGEGLYYERTEDEKVLIRQLVEIKRKREMCYMNHHDWLFDACETNNTGKGKQLRKTFRKSLYEGTEIFKSLAQYYDNRYKLYKTFKKCVKAFTIEQQLIILNMIAPVFIH
jgi:hypothetical protein